jgi:hypothetical protein
MTTSVPSLLAVARGLWGRRRAERLVVLLIDGLGARMLEEFAVAMPQLWSRWRAAGAPLARSCFPSTTVACLPTLGRTAAVAEHGLVGYSFRTGGGDPRVVRPTHLPEGAPALALGTSGPGGPTSFVSAAPLGSRFLSREAFPTASCPRLRGRRGLGAQLGQLAAERGPTFFYLDAVDAAAHRHGIGSRAHLRAMRQADRVFSELAARVPEFTLVVLADHGMVPVEEWVQLEEFAPARDLAAAAGEARAVHLYARPGRERSLRRRCEEMPRALTMGREEAIESGLFEGAPSPAVAKRLGDVLVTFETAGVGVVWSGGPGERRAPAQHGGLSEEETLVPLLEVGDRG